MPVRIRPAIYFFAHRIEKGGGVIQAERTHSALRERGCDSSLIRREGTLSLTDIDPAANVHHFIGANAAYAPLMRSIKERNAGKIALSTIYWWTPAVQRVLTPDLLPFLRYTSARLVKRVFKRLDSRNEVYRLADLLLPNSPGEAALVKKYFPIRRGTLILPVPNAADEISRDIPRNSGPELPTEFVLCAGSFNPRKNQLSLIRALKTTDVPVVFLGAPGWTGLSDSYDEYYKKCKAEATPHMKFIGHVEHRSDEWHRIFSRARVFTMASACETPSLAALEAGLYGAALAITSIGSTYEYFGPYATYCQPHRIESIRAAVMEAWKRGRSGEISVHVASRFLWSNAARLTHLAYQAAFPGMGTSSAAQYHDAAAGLWYEHERHPAGRTDAR